MFKFENEWLALDLDEWSIGHTIMHDGKRLWPPIPWMQKREPDKKILDHLYEPV